MQYVGRFAPTPSGPLHFGSLVTALASWLDARSQQGQWLLRIEDLDPPREMPGASDQILKTLEAFGLYWDRSVVFQSQRSLAYQAALEQLQSSGWAYPCSCTRKELSPHSVYPGFCRPRPCQPDRPLAWRFLVQSEQDVTWLDGVQGEQHWQLKELGDPVIRRKDQLWAYQLAVVVDDLDQGITHLVRGIDLISSTPWQTHLAQHLQAAKSAFHYSHLPIIVNSAGQKLSKQNLAPAIDPSQASSLICQALQLLNQPVDPDWHRERPAAILDQAVAAWQLSKVPKVAQIQQEVN